MPNLVLLYITKYFIGTNYIIHRITLQRKNRSYPLCFFSSGHLLCFPFDPIVVSLFLHRWLRGRGSCRWEPRPSPPSTGTGGRAAGKRCWPSQALVVGGATNRTRTVRRRAPPWDEIRREIHIVRCRDSPQEELQR